jgi:hypothetical protein
MITIHKLPLTPTKNNVFARQTYLTVQGNIAFPVTYQDTGIQTQKNAKAAAKMLILIPVKKAALRVLLRGLYGMGINVFLVQQDQILTHKAKNVNFALQGSAMTRH